MSRVQDPHILFLIDMLYSTGAGTEGVLSRMVRHLPAHGYRCSIATFSSLAERVVTEGLGCPVHRLPIRGVFDRSLVQSAWRLARLIRSEQVSIVHTFFEASDLLGGLVAKLSGCKVVVSGRRDMGYRRSRVERMAYRMAAPLFDQVQAVSEEVRRSHIRQDGLNPDKVATVRNGVDLDVLDAAEGFRPGSLGLAEGTPVVVSVGNVRPVKGTDHLVGTAALVCREIPETRFLVLGSVHDEPYYQRALELARRLGVSDKVVFAGARSDVAAILKTCDVFYLPSLSEGLSNAMLEAMACGLPCVATRVGGNPEVLEDGVSGYLTAVGDERQAAGHILELLRDRGRAAGMGRAGRRAVEERFSVQSMVGNLAQLYDGLLRGTSRRRAPQPGAVKVCANAQGAAE